jgi:hypothetical protein
MSLAVGNHADVTMPNMLIEQLSDSGDYALVSLPWDGTTVDGDGNHVLIKFWIPVGDSRVTIVQVMPVNWPPQENDLWIVPNVTAPAFVVSDGAGTLYFVTAAAIRKAYASQGRPALPPTTEDALSAYGNALTLLHRGNT